jgi:hypothetical protein
MSLAEFGQTQLAEKQMQLLCQKYLIVAIGARNLFLVKQLQKQE